MRKILTVIILLVAFNTIQAQSCFYAVYDGDTIVLNVANTGGGTVQWQITNDSINGPWMPILGAVGNNYQVIIPSPIGQKFVRAEISNSALCSQPYYGSTLKLRVVNNPSQVMIGDYFAGGFVFFKDVNGGGAVISPNDILLTEWGCYGTTVSATSTAFGFGQMNTNMMTSNSCNGAAPGCDTLALNGYSDWYLPSRDELDSIYQKLNGMSFCNFALGADPYWSSSEFNLNEAEVQYFATGFKTQRFKNATAMVRAVRTFIPPVILTVQQRLNNGEIPYAIVNSGVVVDSLYGKTYQDGLIFHFDQATGIGYIAAPGDQSMSMPWGCPSMQIGNTSQLLGTGLSNTQFIVGFCTDPMYAAKICNELISPSYTDWYLPSSGEFQLMRTNLYSKGFGNFLGNMYWTSSENNALSAFQYILGSGSATPYSKNSPCAVRAIRTFTTPLPVLSVQERLDNSETPFQIFSSGVPTDSLIGKIYQEGLIFYLDTMQGNGLVVTPSEVSTLDNWGCQGTFLNAPYTLLGSGRFNTDTMMTKCYAGSSAMRSCVEYTAGGFSWYLPSKDEWFLINQNLHLKGLGNFAATNYWTSTEYDAMSAWLMRIWNGDQITAIKDNTTYIRAVHAFGPPFTCPVVDIDGNEYPTVQIGTQTWMAANLKTSRLNDGTSIVFEPDGPVWSTLFTPAYCWYGNDSSAYCNPYGALYNWYVAQTPNVCPVGWHVPTNFEYEQMITTIGSWMSAGGVLKEPGFIHWDAPNTGTTNTNGFNALPGGFRSSSDGSYFQVRTFGDYHTSNIFDTSNSFFYYFFNGSAEIVQSNHDKKSGNSIRCLKD